MVNVDPMLLLEEETVAIEISTFLLSKTFLSDSVRWLCEIVLFSFPIDSLIACNSVKELPETVISL